ncbi:MAG: FxLYD domain-containing protein [Gemmatimonadetes bacterium]|nr:FxLYD domain-containing protein [Gemmatimonadota bacterium]
MRFLRVLPALSTLLAATPVLAQQVDCPVDVYQPSVLAQAGLTIGRAAQMGEAPEAQKVLRDAMKFLSDEKKFANNPVGAGFLRAQIYVLWMHQAGVGTMLTNEQLGAKGLKTDKVDVLSATDSLLRAVEALAPSCAEQTAQWRGAKPWTDRINKAYPFLGAEAIDSAEFYTKQSAQLNPTSPFVHNAFAQIANKRGDMPTMMTHLRAAITEAAKDTSLAETRKQMQFQLAQTAQGYAMTGGAAQKAQLQKEALDIYAMLLAQAPGTTEGAYAFSAAAEIVSLSQDSTAARVLLAPLVATPAAYSDLTLILASDVARAFSRTADAIAMYEGALAKNPNIRDANYFLAYMYYEAKQPEKMIPLTDRLIEIDPSNGDNFLMRAYAYQLMTAAERDPRKKAELQKKQDEYAGRENTMATQHKLLITRFERRATGALLGGTIENFTKAPRSFALKMEFLDTAGNVVETMTTDVANVKPGERGTFEFTATKPGIVAYRYEALK